MRAYYSDTYTFPLPEGHRFPIAKYRRLRERALAEGVLQPEEVHLAPAISDEAILRAHSADYLERVVSGRLSAQEIRRLGFPWSPQLVERARRSAGATLAAARAALQEGVGVNLAGGTHHAAADHGEGFCLFNDVAIAVRTLAHEGRLGRALIVDLDVHQGNGTAAILRGDPHAFTLSLHGERNFPFRKEPSDLDIPLPDDTGDTAYLTALRDALDRAFAASHPTLVFYLAGADPYHGDLLGRLALSKDGLAARDRLVFARCQAEGVPVTVVMGGGYAKNVDDIVDIHLNTLRLARTLDRLRTP